MAKNTGQKSTSVMTTQLQPPNARDIKKKKSKENMYVVLKAFNFFRFSLCQDKKICSVMVENKLEKS